MLPLWKPNRPSFKDLYRAPDTPTSLKVSWNDQIDRLTGSRA